MSSGDIVRPENLSKAQPAQILSHSGAKRQQGNLSNIFFDQQKPSENRQKSKATPGLGHGTRDAEERFRW